MQLGEVIFWTQVIGLCCGVTGTVLIYFFGVPRQIDTGGVNVLSLSGDQRYDVQEIVRIKRFKRWGATGIALVALAFLLQLAAVMMVG